MPFRFPAPIQFVILVAFAIIYLIGAFYYLGFPKIFKLYKTDITPPEHLILKRQIFQFSTNMEDYKNFDYERDRQFTLNFGILESGLYISPKPINQYISSVLTVLRLSSFISVPSVPSLLIPWREFNKYEIIIDRDMDEAYRFYAGIPAIIILTLKNETVRQLETLAEIQINDLIDCGN